MPRSSVIGIRVFIIRSSASRGPQRWPGESPGHRCGPREAEERMMKTRIPITDERGIAFPMAMIVLTVLMALMAAFAFLATSEPQIAANHMASVQARSLAESGLERAL